MEIEKYTYSKYICLAPSFKTLAICNIQTGYVINSNKTNILIKKRIIKKGKFVLEKSIFI